MHILLHIIHDMNMVFYVIEITQNTLKYFIKSLTL